jgi:hypothetical protein
VTAGNCRSVRHEGPSGAGEAGPRMSPTSQPVRRHWPQLGTGMGFLDDMKDKASEFVEDVKDKMDSDDDDTSSDSGADGGADAGADVPGVNDTDADMAPTTSDTLGGTGDYADSADSTAGGYDDSLGTTGSSLDDTRGSTYDDSAGSMTSGTYDETAGPTSSTYDDTVGAGGMSAAGADDPGDALGDVTTDSPGGLGDRDRDR